MNDALLTVLKEYGLNQKEAMIYLVILEAGKAPASKVARQSGLKRVTAYAIMQDMVRKGVLMQSDARGTKQFSVIDPDRLHAQREVKCKAFQSALPEFAALADVRGNKPRMQYFEGFNGILKMYEDMLTSKVDICAFVGVDCVTKEMQKQLNESHVKSRVKLGIRAKVISNPTVMSNQYKDLDEIHLRETRMVNSSNFKLDGEIDMYGPDRVSFIMYSGDEMSGVIIHSEKLYNSMCSIFNFIWETA